MGAVCYAVLRPGWWVGPVAVPVFVVFAGTGLTMSARATRP
jgi:hypothetical protein